MVILILIDVQYLKKVVFSFQKGSNGQNYSFSDSHCLIKIPPHQDFSFPLTGGIPPTPKCYLGNLAVPENIFEIRRLD